MNRQLLLKSNRQGLHRLLVSKTSQFRTLLPSTLPVAVDKLYYDARLNIGRRRWLSAGATTPDHDWEAPIKPWETNVVESHGDYRDEVYLEKHIGGPLYQYQENLPRLPIPTIEDTLKRFLPTALPLAKSQEEKDKLLAACEAFPEEAKVLQERLIDRRDNEMKDSSWLQLWWNQLGYLQFRDSVVVNVSYFFQFQDDPTIIRDDVDDSPTNVRRAASLLFSAAEFRKLVASGGLQAETVGKKQTPLCSTAYKYMFHACRIPNPIQDSYRIYDPSRYGHAIVARKGHFFAIDLVDSHSGGGPLPLDVLEKQLAQCISMADKIPSSRPKLGLLTTSNRDNWTEARNTLIEEGGTLMEEALELLQSGVLLVNLDDETPMSRQEGGELLLTGGLSSGANRWFDKSIQMIVANNGKVGLCGEHAMMDGMPLVNFADYITNQTYSDVKERSSKTDIVAPAPRDIFEGAIDAVDDATLQQLEAKAWDEFKGVVDAQSNTAQSFQGYGSDFIKKAGHSPDAYVQVAMQLASYRLWGAQGGTYEATQVRPFLHGRTETTRTVSSESEAFVKLMGLSPRFDETEASIRKEKLDLLQKATAAHSQYTTIAAQAQGVDRHFFGLSMLIADGEGSPKLFDDPTFVRSKRWRVSTSHLTHPRFVNWGFGQVVPDGVGIGYSILPRSCTFNISSLKETGWTPKVSELLEEALLEMQRLVEMEEYSPQSKL